MTSPAERSFHIAETLDGSACVHQRFSTAWASAASSSDSSTMPATHCAAATGDIAAMIEATSSEPPSSR